MEIHKKNAPRTEEEKATLSFRRKRGVLIGVIFFLVAIIVLQVSLQLI